MQNQEMSASMLWDGSELAAEGRAWRACGREARLHGLESDDLRRGSGKRHWGMRATDAAD